MLLVFELYYIVDFVCVMCFCDDESSDMFGILVMVVFLEGVVRYWFSFIYGSSIIDMDVDLIGL